ncbi:sulfotransferase [Arenicella chitinivorans]|uniref:Sulfotransferase n=2 Tax=Arenicella chitinivorans TaxID=1329800 RepID=A0A918RU92_9GAMM|nr:sulfotransferase [Arenicella chitinivorans]
MQYAGQILNVEPNSPEGLFLRGLSSRAQGHADAAISALQAAFSQDPARYDAAVELAAIYSLQRQNSKAADLLERVVPLLNNSPRYLDLAGTVYTEIGLIDKAYPLFVKAAEIQPGIDVFEANLATCSVYLGKIDEGIALYESLLQRNPSHRKNHYQLSRLRKAENETHIAQMQDLLLDPNVDPRRNVPLLFAIAKELEDLQRWPESFTYYQRGCDAISQQLSYRVEDDVALIDQLIETCSEQWVADQNLAHDKAEPTPIFIVGLPRTGTTLVERIISSHSEVESLGETLFLPRILQSLGSQVGGKPLSAQTIRDLGKKDLSGLPGAYLNQVGYRLQGAPMFIEKLPFNFLYAGFVAKTWPHAKFVHLVRQPMDACFSMYKQVFTGAYPYSYRLADLGRYYVAYDRLRQHWQRVLGDRFIEVEYEALVTDQAAQTTDLLRSLSLEYEPQCLQFERNQAPSATASSVQVRSGVHSGSVNKWRRYEAELAPLRAVLEANGITVG